MNYFGYLIYVVIFAALIGYTVWMRKRMAQAHTDAAPAYIDFFRRTGYCHPELWGQPPEVQAERSRQQGDEMVEVGKRQARGENVDFEMQYVRSYHGLTLRYRSGFGHRKEGPKNIYYRSNSWEADLPSLPNIPIHIADRALSSISKSLVEGMTNSERKFTQKCRLAVQTGIPAIDLKFLVFGENPDHVRWLFSQNPMLIDLLMGWAEVDVWVTAQGASFNDPGLRNIQAAMGGMVGNMALGLDMKKRMELSIPVHDRASDLLLSLVRATCPPQAQ